MTEKGICLICGKYFEREEKERVRVGCGDCGETPKEMAKSMFLAVERDSKVKA